MEEYVPPVVVSTPPPPPPPARRAPPSVPVAPKTASFTQQTSSPVNNGVPAWKAELEARKAGVIPNSGAVSSSPVPAARRGGPPAPGQKPLVPAKPVVPAKPMVPSRPGGAPKPAPRAPPRVAGGADPSNAAASLADAVSFFSFCLKEQVFFRILIFIFK